MVKRVRLSVRHGTTGRIIGFIYFDQESIGGRDAPVTAVDDGRVLTTGLNIPFEDRDLCQFLEVTSIEIDDTPKVFDF